MRCNYCERRCVIAEGGTGFCLSYAVSGDAIHERFSHRWSSCGPYVMEAIPFYHAYPGDRCLAIGTAGCNFRCRYCSNAHIAKEDPEIQQDQMYHLTSRELVSMAQKANCRAIVFNVNEPTVSIPSLLDLAREAKAAAIPMGCLTNGYSTVESTELLASIFSFFNISLKGISASFNKAYIGIESSRPVLRTIRRLAQDRHVEVTTPIIEGANDIEIDTIAGFLAEVDPEIPWHVFRLLPEDEMKSTEYPNIQAIDQALQSARKRLRYVYFHNFVGSEWVNTTCPACGTILIERFSLGCGGDKLNRLYCEDNRCPDCGREIRLIKEKSCLEDVQGVQP
jgi:pyruvate formate lyase activating enzyme